MNLLVWTLFGILAGVITHKLDPFPAKGGLLGAAFFGLCGALVGGFVSSLVFGGTNGFDLLLLIMAGGASLFLLLIHRTFLLRT